MVQYCNNVSGPCVSFFQVLLDDGPAVDVPDVTSVAIPATQVLKNSHVLYQIDCTNTRRRRSFQNWTVLKRYSEFATLDGQIRQECAGRPSVLASLPALPPKVQVSDLI